MTSLHPDRLTTEGAPPATGTRSARSQAPGGTSRSAAASASVTAPVKTQGTASAKATRAVAAPAKTPTTKPAARKPATSKAATAKAAPAKPAVRKPATAKAATAKPAARKPATAKPATAKPATAKPATARPAAVTPQTTVEAVVPAAPMTAQVRRPTPRKRTPVAVDPAPAEVATPDAPAVAAPPADEYAPAAEEQPSPRRGRHRRAPSRHRRRALYLAAAVVGALTLSAASVGGSSAFAETGAFESVSVAEALGVEATETQPIVSAETTDRLGELVASRAERDEEQAHAAAVQAKADKKAVKAAKRAAKAAAEAARPKAVLPVKGARFTSGFGVRWGTLHAGIDLAAPMRTPEMAAMDGVVLEAGPASGFGLAVYIQHENGDVTVYGHMDEILVKAGQVVKAGDKIALLGNRGQSTGPHLHFEVHKGGLNGTKIDPIPWLKARGVRV
jgi:murein DD-endopeptidase MepM/ murein hydrolase activator NlpD